MSEKVKNPNLKEQEDKRIDDVFKKLTAAIDALSEE